MAWDGADRELYVTLLAWRAGFLARTELIDVLEAWSVAKARPVSQILVDRGALTSTDRALLEALADRYAEKWGGEVGSPSPAFEIDPALLRSLATLEEPEPKASVARLRVHESAAPGTP